MRREHLRPVIYNGELVAVAGADRFHMLAPWLDERAPADPERKFVELLCHFHRQVLQGKLPASASPADAERWALLILGQPASDDSANR